MTVATAPRSAEVPASERSPTGTESPAPSAEICIQEIHRNNGRALLRFLRSLVSSDSAHTAEDLVQETMLRAWRSLDAVPIEPESQRRWLFTVARRLAIDAYRKRQSRPAEISLVDTEPVGVGSEAAETVIAKLTLQQAIAGLSPAHRSVLVELHVKGNSLEQAAARLGVPVGTVKSRAHYAMKFLREALDGTEAFRR
ncbi:sigma-70 family RNA polymerase sigma factor [Micromonospora maris]|uniref:sigma-70 family RNA polymerase sigma factor n=1 Tax=Micromonospora maris TaxID=1003110 RepID=UPI002E125B1D|nr:sigma-70 family RNA polymerase sigma factor [Micromonospora maris]WSK40013.1 sigma-70 family RNA polymerase sigma factor [Micromonospora maris]